jgi:predicted helicase
LTSFYDVLDHLRRSALDEHDKGKRFENLVRRFLTTAPTFAQQFEKVIPFVEWEGREDDKDRGVDLVGFERVTGDLCAIQCKFYGEDDYIDLATISTFFTALGKSAFASGLIVTTSNNWSKNAEKALEDQTKPVRRIGLEHFAEADLDWASFVPDDVASLHRLPPKRLRPHQQVALERVLEGFRHHDRGKMIMACGTGKTLASLKIAETMLPQGGQVLFLVPSIALLSQTLREWTTECSMELRSFAVCSDTKVGKNKDESDDIQTFDLAYPATTSPKRLVQNFHIFTQGFDGLTVMFSTYQSLDVIAEAQRQGLPGFDLVICDEAHRTTGATLAEEEESAFVRVHDGSYIESAKRLYMTATPRVYGENVKAKAEQTDALLASMDDENLYGPEFHRLMFGEAVAQGLLADYRVVTLSVSEEFVAELMADRTADMLDLPLDDVARIIGCYNGLAKNADSSDQFAADPAPMRRAVAFARTIKESKAFSKRAAEVVNDLLLTEADEESVRLDVHHVDGTQNVLKRNAELEWLKAPVPSGAVRILSNARCLSEGVDVPALDAVLFLSPRNSVVDVVQSVGRVMRKSEGKQYGYVIIPVAIPNFEDPKHALDDNRRYKTVWQVLQALRSHDERFAAMINKVDLNKALAEQTIFAGVGGPGDGEGTAENGDAARQKVFSLGDMPLWGDAVLAKLVSKVGQRAYWENWAMDVADVTRRYQARIKALVDAGGTEQQLRFAEFVEGLRTVLNPSVTEAAAVEMLAQHMVTRPVFDALFEGYSFSASNPVSQVMEGMITALEGESLDVETESLDKFYDSVRMRVQGITTAVGKQQVIKELYDKFFQGAFSVTAAKLGIVYTPVEVVDYMIHAVERVLRSSFQTSLGDKGVHVLDPFTGTGTFITRMLQSGIIKPEDLDYKYRYELHANEIVLLAYYIAAVNIEETFHSDEAAEYVPFDGLVLTDTFQMTESEMKEWLDGKGIFPGLSERARAENSLDIKVIISNPPYSVGQEREGEGDANEKYHDLDLRVGATYRAKSTANLTKALDDSYIRAFRWASDRIGELGVVCFVSGGGWLVGNSTDGMRRCLVEEFQEIYVLDLRGNARTTQGERRRKEGGGVFGEGSRTAVTITMLVKKPDVAGPARIMYHDIGDYLSREDKLQKLVDFAATEPDWVEIIPNEYADWIDQRRSDFEKLVPLTVAKSKRAEASAIFTNSGHGLNTARDSWTYSFSPLSVKESMQRLISTYESLRQANQLQRPTDGILQGPKNIKWDAKLTRDLASGKEATFSTKAITKSLYRPFVTEYCYFDPMFNTRVGQLPNFLPLGYEQPPMIVVSGVGSSSGFSALMTNRLPNFHTLDSDQIFPLFWYEVPAATGGLLAGQDLGLTRREGVSTWAVEKFSTELGRKVPREEIFYYTYGILHSEIFRAAYEDNLVKERPRIPLVKTVEEFDAFVAAGRALADLHLNYEAVEPYALEEVCTHRELPARELYRVAKMTFPKGLAVKDRPSSIVFNNFITLNGIPDEIWDYMLSGKAALYWIMDRYRLTQDKESGIVNDPNEYSDDPRYIVDLVKQIVTVSVRTLEIIRSLPPLTFD